MHTYPIFSSSNHYAKCTGFATTADQASRLSAEGSRPVRYEFHRAVASDDWADDLAVTAGGCFFPTDHPLYRYVVERLDADAPEAVELFSAHDFAEVRGWMQEHLGVTVGQDECWVENDPTHATWCDYWPPLPLDGEDDDARSRVSLQRFEMP